MMSRRVVLVARASVLLACGCASGGNPDQTDLIGGVGGGVGGIGGTGAPTAGMITAGTTDQGGTPAINEGAGAAGVSGTSGSFAAAGEGGSSAGVGGMSGVSAAGSSAGTAGSSALPTGCGSRAGMRGKTSRSVMVGGVQRTFIAYLPPMANVTTPLPFVYVFHGATQTGQNLYDMTEYAALADTEGIAVVFPDGQGASSERSMGALSPWHVSDGPLLCGLGTLVSNPNATDLDFVDAIRADIEQDQCIDADHVFATGFSMGGYFTHHIACNRPDFMAAAPHSGGTMANLSTCTTSRMPIIIFHGTNDLLIAANCNDPKAPADPAFTASATLWAMKNGCQPTYTTIPANGSNGSNGSCYLYDGCPADGQVQMCAFQGMAHGWAGAPTCPGCIGEGPSYASATRLQWEFFKQYAW